ncbi:hypothetical protein BDB01DRAFT_782362 [Pilobolus umbonatus]|nr:hypothetical protein BDB01DRAFT_782362 [Pilobolus umbonatus]
MIPTKAVILYSPTPSNDNNIHNVDTLTEQGCSGLVSLESQNPTIIEQLLGIDIHSNNKKTSFVSRFNTMSLAIVSNSYSTQLLAQSLGCLYSKIPSITDIMDIVSDDHLDCIFVDTTDYTQPWSFINDLVAVLMKCPDILKCVISVIPSPITTPTTEWWKDIVPVQSNTVKEGITVSIDKKTSLMASYLHHGSVRRDTVKQYRVSDICTHGGNKSILAWHFLLEISHKLGLLPKYGA